MPAEEPAEFPIKIVKIEIPPLRDDQSDSSSSHSNVKPNPPTSEKNPLPESGFLKLGSDIVGWDFIESTRPSDINSATLETDVDHLISFILQPPSNQKSNEQANHDKEGEAEPEPEVEADGDEEEASSSSEEEEQEEQDESDSSVQQSSAAATVSSTYHATDSASERTDTKSAEREWDRPRAKRKRDEQPLSRSERRRVFID